MSSLKRNLESLAASFATDVVRAIQGASLEELRSEVVGASRRVGRPAATSSPAKAVRRTRGGRLPRRSPEDIAKALDGVVALVKRHKTGLRAEQIRQELGMLPKEMPRVLQEGLSKKVLKSKGQKRATTYFTK
jgi:hypothetical protein